MMQVIRTITNKTDRKRSTEIDESKSNRDSTTSSVLQKGQHEHSDIEKLADNAADDNTTVASSDKPGETDACDPFGNEEGGEIHYRTMEWWHVGLLMIAETISLGILSLPTAVATLGLVPGVILICGFGILATYTGYVIGQFKLAYPQIQNMGDAGFILFGRIGSEIIGIAQVIVIVFIMSAHITSFSILMNVLTNHGACSILFGFIGLVVSFLLALPRTQHVLSYVSVVSCISVVTAVVVAMVSLSITRPDVGNVHATTEVSLAKAMIAVLNIIISYAGHVAFFGFTAELRDPRDFPKALYLLQSVSTSFYIIVAVVIYYYAGPSVPAPALSAASPLVRKIAYGIAIPTIVVAGVVNGHVACKQLYVRWWRGTNVMQQKSFKSVASWVFICAGLWVLSWLIAEAIPSFSQLLALVSALFCGWFSYGLSGLFWLKMNKGQLFASPRKTVLTVVNICIVCIGTIICGLGLYASGKGLASGAGGHPFSCADNIHQ